MLCPKAFGCRRITYYLIPSALTLTFRGVTKRKDRAAHTRAQIAKLENPYAFVETEPAGRSVEEPFVDRRRAYIRLLENQYASLSIEDEQKPVDALSTEPRQLVLLAANRGCSKTEFRARCRSVFAGYIPALEKGKLREHHRAFITRNESRTSEERYRLVVHLEKYNLSSHLGLKAQFNRERDVFTEEKLRQIERDAEES